jgi:hypothetical protein
MRLLFTFLLLFLAPLAASAATTEYDIQAQLFVEGKLVASPRLLTVPGEPAELSQMTDTSKDKIRIRIIATDDSHKIENGIALKFEIYYRKGKKIVESSPEITAKPGEQNTLDIGKANHQNVELKVRAIRIE